MDEISFPAPNVLYISARGVPRISLTTSSVPRIPLVRTQYNIKTSIRVHLTHYVQLPNLDGIHDGDEPTKGDTNEGKGGEVGSSRWARAGTPDPSPTAVWVEPCPICLGGPDRDDMFVVVLIGTRRDGTGVSYAMSVTSKGQPHYIST